MFVILYYLIYKNNIYRIYIYVGDAGSAWVIL